MTMSENSKNEMLNRYKKENENFEAKMWGTLMPKNKDLFAKSLQYSCLGPLGAGITGASGALSNQYCYVGMTEIGIYFVVVKMWKVEEVEHAFKLPYEAITKVTIKSSIIPGRRVLHIDSSIGKLQLSLMSNAIGTDIQGQKEAVQYFCDTLEKRLQERK